MQATGWYRCRFSAWTCSSPRPARCRSEGTDGIALWMLDTDYNEESFFVRHAYFLGANDPLQGVEDDFEGGDRRGSVGKPLFGHVTAVCEARSRPDRR